MDLNPFEAPVSPTTGPSQPGVRRSPWALLRFVPATYFGFFALMLPAAVAILGADIYFASATPRGAHPPLARSLLVDFATGSVGVLSVLTAHAWSARRWRRACLLSILFFAIMISAGVLDQAGYFRWFREPAR